MLACGAKAKPAPGEAPCARREGASADVYSFGYRTIPECGETALTQDETCLGTLEFEVKTRDPLGGCATRPCFNLVVPQGGSRPPQAGPKPQPRPPGED